MAKRKRLTPAQTEFLNTPAQTGPQSGPLAGPAAPEVKSALGPTNTPLSAPPIAQVAGEASAMAALQEVTTAMRTARAEGLLVQRLPLADIVADHLSRDRLMADAEDLSALVESIRDHGQRTPIEVVELKDGRYGLISGWRRLTALELLAEETGDAKYRHVLALLRRPEHASDAYVAMVEENEVRVGLSYYERARVVALAVAEGVFATEKLALGRLFATASRAKRSKINSFLTVYHALDQQLRFPTQMGERQGLALARALEADTDLAAHLQGRLTAANPQTPEVEQAVLADGLKPAPVPASGSASGPASGETGAGQGDQPPAPADKNPPTELSPGVFLRNEGGYLKRRLVLDGPKVDADFQARLEAWLKAPR